jgi:hypothetical protein
MSAVDIKRVALHKQSFDRRRMACASVVPLLSLLAAGCKSVPFSNEVVFPGAGGAYKSKIPDGFPVYVTFISYPKTNINPTRLKQEQALAKTFGRFNESVGKNAYGYWPGSYDGDRKTGTFNPQEVQAILGRFNQKLEDGPYLLFSVERPTKPTLTTKTYAIDFEWADPSDIEDYVLMFQQVFRDGNYSLKDTVLDVNISKMKDIVVNRGLELLDRFEALAKLLPRIKQKGKPDKIRGQLLDVKRV